MRLATRVVPEVGTRRALTGSRQRRTGLRTPANMVSYAPRAGVRRHWRSAGGLLARRRRTARAIACRRAAANFQPRSQSH